MKAALSHRVGDKLLKTNNDFEQQLLLGSDLVHQADDDRLVLHPDVVYKKNVRRQVPPVTSSRRGDVGTVRLTRGMRRWTALPDIVEVAELSFLPAAARESIK